MLLVIDFGPSFQLPKVEKIYQKMKYTRHSCYDILSLEQFHSYMDVDFHKI